MDKKHPRNYIKQLREHRGMTLDDVAGKTGVSNPYISMLEQSKRGLSWAMVRKLSDAFKCHPLEITDGPVTETTVKTRQEKELLEKFRGFSDGEKKMFSHMLESFAHEKAKTAKEDDGSHNHAAGKRKKKE